MESFFQAIHRLWSSCNATPVCQEQEGVEVPASKMRVGWTTANGQQMTRSHGTHNGRRGCLTDLGHGGPYLAVASYLGMSDLITLDASCRLLRELHMGLCGPWFWLGVPTFRGIELSDGVGPFQPSDSGCGKDSSIGDWKQRLLLFRSVTTRFRAPFAGQAITDIKEPYTNAYCRCQLRTDLLMQLHKDAAGGSVFFHFQVSRNPDHVCLVVFTSGYCSSVAFDPAAGVVIRQRKVKETPREGKVFAFQRFQPLVQIAEGQFFKGGMGLYFCGGHLAFFRRRAIDVQLEGQPQEERADVEVGPWETTGFVTDLSWAEGNTLKPCLAFNKEGEYDVRMVSVCATPPIVPERNAAAYNANWPIEGYWSANEMEEI